MTTYLPLRCFALVHKSDWVMKYSARAVTPSGCAWVRIQFHFVSWGGGGGQLEVRSVGASCRLSIHAPGS